MKRDILIIDFEVFRYDWLCVIIEPSGRKKVVIVNDAEKLNDYYEEHKEWIWVGYNIRQYDQFILKGILLGMDPADINDHIIRDNEKGYTYSRAFSKVKLYFYDLMNKGDMSLKWYEGSMGESIEESSVPFDIPRRLTGAEIDESVKYCTHDVEQTMKVFLERKSDFDAHIKILSMFHLPISDVSKTKVQLSAKILDAERTSFHDEFDITIPDNLRIRKYMNVVDFYRNPRNRDYDRSLSLKVAGVPHSFGWGGVHGAVDKAVFKGYLINMDVASLYPSLMIEYGLTSRACNPQKFKDMVNLRLKYKHEGNPLQKPLKILINGTYGASKDPNNPLFDPLQANNVCIHGQLFLLDLVEHLEAIDAEIIQTNTDGVLVRMSERYGDDREEFKKAVHEVADEWMKRTRLVLEFDEYKAIYQKDVNNYVLVPEGDLYDGKGKPRWKSKGAYTKKIGNLDWDLAVVNKAITEKLLKGTPIRKTVYEDNNLADFQIVERITSLYSHILHGNRKLDVKCIRCFASEKYSDDGVFKVHAKTKEISKISGTPERVRLINGNVNGMTVPSWLDRNWYVTVAEERIKNFSPDEGLF